MLDPLALKDSYSATENFSLLISCENQFPVHKKGSISSYVKKPLGHNFVEKDIIFVVLIRYKML